MGRPGSEGTLTVHKRLGVVTPISAISTAATGVTVVVMGLQRCFDAVISWTVVWATEHSRVKLRNAVVTWSFLI